MAVKRKKPEGISLAWMMIFTDLVALLLTFFVMLFSMSVLTGRHLQKSSKRSNKHF